jgi:hypothetical protein
MTAMTNDKHISTRVWLPNEDGIAHHAEVLRRKHDGNGNLIGHSHANPILVTSLYDAEFNDGRVGTCSAKHY